MPNNNRGRNSKKHIIQENIPRIRAMIRDGYTEEQCANTIGVAYSTFMKWKPEIPELLEVLKESKEFLIAELEDTLYRKALGKCTVKETKKYIERDKAGKEKTKIEETVREIAPDTTLLIFALKNLTIDNGKWLDRHEGSTFSELQSALDNFKSFSEKVEKANKDSKKEILDEDNPLSSI